nr:MAG TPA: cathepsin L [Caudoviricetes sp.]
MTYRRQGIKEIPNQRDEASCTAYALCSIINGFKDPKYRAEGVEWEYLNGSDFFALANSKYPEDIQGPLTSTQALVYAKEMGYIREYASLKQDQTNYEVFKLMLKAGALLLLNVNKINRDKISASDPVAQYTLGSIPHAVACVDYDDENKVIKILNSR